MPQPIRIDNLAKYQPYRHLNHTRAAVVGEGASLPTAQGRAMALLETKPFDGVQFLVKFEHDGTVPAAAVQLDVLFYDADNDIWSVDADQRIDIDAPGAATYNVLTGGRPVYLRITAVSGNQVVLDIKAAVFTTSRS